MVNSLHTHALHGHIEEQSYLQLYTGPFLCRVSFCVERLSLLLSQMPKNQGRRALGEHLLADERLLHYHHKEPSDAFHCPLCKVQYTRRLTLAAGLGFSFAIRPSANLTAGMGAVDVDGNDLKGPIESAPELALPNAISDGCFSASCLETLPCTSCTIS